MDHRFRYRLEMLKAKKQGFFPFTSWATLLRLFTTPTLGWPMADFVQLLESDEERGWRLYRSPLGEFWAPKEDGEALASTAIEILSGVYEKGASRISSGDTVFDLGGNLGTFTRLALARGAGQVIVCEAHPTYRACIERTFAKEIQTRRVTVVGQPVWSEKKTLRFAGSHLVGHVATEGEDGVEMESVTLDEIVERLGLRRVHYLKADIEGAERHALQGAAELIRRQRPKIAFCVYHYEDDPAVMEAILRSYHQDYALSLDSSHRYIYAW